MITWLQNFFLKHNKWLFGGLLIVIIVTFVLTIGPQSFFDSAGPQRRESIKFYGYDLSSESDQRAMVQHAEMSAILHPELRVNREQLMDYAYLRVAALGIAGRIGVPEPDTDALTAYIEGLDLFANPQTGEFSAEAYRNVMNALQSNGRYEREFIARVLREDYRIAQVRKALGGPVYSLPFELKKDYETGETVHEAVVAHLDYATFTPEIEPGDEALRQYFNENPGRYEVPETISADALRFTSEAWIDTVPQPDDEQLETYFTANRDRYQEAVAPDDDEAAAEEPAEVTLADVRDTVIADWRDEQAARMAARRSEQFSLRLWQENIALDSPQFNQLLEEFRVQRQPIPPYSREQSPRIGDLPVSLLNSMWIFASNPNRYFSDIAQVDDGAVMLVANDVTPARMPEFEEIRDNVLSDYARAEKRRLFAEKGRELRDTIRERLAGEEPFAEIAESLGLDVREFESFTGASVPMELQRSAIWEQARFLDAGEISDMALQADRGTFLFMAAKSVPEIDTESEDYQEYLAQREQMLNDAMGWARLREITDQSLTALLGTSLLQ
jgi:peptidyl-prolyl cis-trans isomerase D